MEFIALLARVCHELFFERKDTSSNYRELWSAGIYKYGNNIIMFSVFKSLD